MYIFVLQNGIKTDIAKISNNHIQGRPQDFGLGGGANFLRQAQNKDSRKARKIL